VRIISKHKDFWHYLTGVYGIDNKIIYDITDGYGVIDNQPYTDVTNRVIYPSNLELHICGTKYIGVWDDGCYRWSLEYLNNLYVRYMTELHGHFRNVWMSDISDYIHVKPDDQIYWRRFKKSRIPEVRDTVGIPSNLNVEHKCPVIWVNNVNHWKRDYNYNPILLKTNIQSVLPAEEIYLKITNFLSYKEPEINMSPTDMNRFESKGFDKKSSFRKL
jgi:hypothetical protein